MRKILKRIKSRKSGVIINANKRVSLRGKWETVMPEIKALRVDLGASLVAQ